MKRLTTILLALALALAVCPAALAQGGAAPIKQLTIGTTMQIKAINIDDYYYGILRTILTHTQLISLNEKGEFAGNMAESWHTEDGKTWIFKLRKDLTWHDGKKVTAHDVAFSIKYFKAKVKVYQFHFKLVEDAKAIDDYTVEVTLSKSNPRLPVNLLVLRTVPKHIFEKVDDLKAFQGAKAAIGCGPYVFEKFDRGAGLISFVPYGKYYRGRPNVDRVVVRMFKNPDTMYMAFRKGEIDLPYIYAAGADPVHARALAKNPNIKIHRINNMGVPNVLFFNTKKEPMNNLALRNALSYAVNYKELVRLFAGGFGTPANRGFVPKATSVFIKTPALIHDPQKAASLLVEMGYKDRDGDGLLDKDGKALRFQIVTRTDNPGNMRLGELIKKYFKTVGVGVDIKPVDSTLFRQISDREQSHQALISRTTPWGMLMWAGCGSGYFDSRNCAWSVLDDPKFHAIVDIMNQTLDQAEYKKAAADLQSYYAENLPGIALYWNSQLQPYRKDITGWKISPMYGFLWGETWYSIRKEK